LRSRPRLATNCATAAPAPTRTHIILESQAELQPRQEPRRRVMYNIHSAADTIIADFADFRPRAS
jgi:hypothetical protein